jgi:hypothetical protein
VSCRDAGLHPEPLPQLGDGFDLTPRQARLGAVRPELATPDHVRDRGRVHTDDFGGIAMGDRIGRTHVHNAKAGDWMTPLPRHG